MKVLKEVVRQVGAQEAPPQGSHRSRLFSSTRCRHNEYHDALCHNFRLAKISVVILDLDIKVSQGSYERIFINIKYTAFEMCHPTMMGNSSCIILGIPRLRSIDDGEHRQHVVCRVVKGRARGAIQI